MINPKSLAMVLFAVAFGFASLNVQAAPGDTYVVLDTTFVDNASGNTYSFTIDAVEYQNEEGVGDVFFGLNGPRLSLVTVGKGWQDSPPSDYRPLALIKPAKAGHQAVDIGEKVVEISAHAFAHIDAPNDIVFIGTVTVDVRIETKSGDIKVVIYSPKGKTKLQGKTTP